MRRLLIAGCGDLGARLAARLTPGLWAVTGLRRNPARLPTSIRPLPADLASPGTLAPASGSWDAVVYTATPGSRSPDAYRRTYVAGLEHLLATLSFQRLIFVSSTAVYGQDGGEWVDEESDTQPATASGRVLLEAETMARAAGGIVVRFGGIYGPGREFLLRQVRSGPVPCRRDPPFWTNRIHADDCANVLARLLETSQADGIYCATDNRPAPRWEVLSWLAHKLGVPGPEEVPDGAGQGKRVRNRRLASAGVRLKYPDFRAGYADLLAHEPTN